MNIKIEKSWARELSSEFDKKYFQELFSFVSKEYLNKTVYPAAENLFQAFNLCPFDRVKVVILGQDPYHGPKQAHGLCFSVQDGIHTPPSLKNIYKEIESDIGIKMSSSGNLEPWAKQGVFLLNATLTVLANQAGSHQKKGWEEFTDSVIKTISDKKNNVVFLLWGAYAQSKTDLIDSKKHLILKAPHPSPLSSYRGFFGSKHFSQTNAYLQKTNQNVIDWLL
ncbi:MAG: uracil-DNA glycosylase [Patescibacteria group bacterium]|jgi:uracil-DNA glycosylase|nr:uracil-DNA glycosylase [Patescibacteria group bacterium]